MEVHQPPAKLTRFSEPGLLTMGGPSIGLGLGLGLGPSGKSAFTFLQLQEFEHQALIFKYMAAGIPVPFHLVLPIWKSIANSASGLSKHYPSWLGCGSLCFDYRNSMEPEPGRCRRTDGKKWRCSKDVVPDQKYCERHMHRGRHRSRKPVEGNAVASNAMITTTATSSNSNLAGSSMDSSTQLSISMPGAAGLQSMTTVGGNASLRSGFFPTSVLHAAGGCKVETSSI